nr:EpsG family protein [Pediococcus pentosaceus]
MIAEFLKNRTLQNLIRFASILPMAVIAGLRNNTIGTDISNYGLINFESATHFNNFFEYLKYIKSINGVEIGYSLLNFVVSRFTNSVNWFFFVLNLLTILFVFLALSGNQERKYFTIGMILYYLIFWDISLNVMRQSLAVTMVFYGTVLFINSGKIKTFVVIVLAASLIHQTAIIALLIPVIYWISIRNNKNMNYVIFITISVLVYYVMAPNSNLITKMMESIPLFGKYYSIFLNSGISYVTTGSGMSIKTIIIRTFPMLISLIWLIRSKNSNKYIDKNKSFFTFILMISVAFEFVNINSGVFARLGMYFSIIQILIYLKLSSTVKLTSMRLFLVGFLILYLMVVAYVRVTSGYGQIYPYTSDLLAQLV